jgi:hypothetical protein
MCLPPSCKNKPGTDVLARALKVLDEMIKPQDSSHQVSKDELYHAHTLRCGIQIKLNYRAPDTEAEVECNKAIALDENKWPARQNLGRIYLSRALSQRNPVTLQWTSEALENCRKADHQFTIADKAHALNSLSRLCWLESVSTRPRSRPQLDR